jgi:sulfatase modifying factor 1
MITKQWMRMAIAVGLSWATGVRAGDLNPPGAPGPTMHTLEEIYQQLLATQAQVADLQARMIADGSFVNASPAFWSMILIPAGSFVMGANTNIGPTSLPDQLPQHTVTVSAFYMDQFEVSSNLWTEVYAWATNNGYGFDFVNPGHGRTGLHPMHMVDWQDAIVWCNARSERDGFTPCYTNQNGTIYTNNVLTFTGGCNWNANGYRLPTEAEWEKAARGGASDRRFSWPDANTIQHKRANYYASPGGPEVPYDTSATSGYHPDFQAFGFPYTARVGQFPGNAYGLFDMVGNVREWCWDWYSPTYYASSPSTNPTGPASGTQRVLRSGSWDVEADSVTCASRHADDPTFEADFGYGFRCVRRP